MVLSQTSIGVDIYNLQVLKLSRMELLELSGSNIHKSYVSATHVHLVNEDSSLDCSLTFT